MAEFEVAVGTYSGALFGFLVSVDESGEARCAPTFSVRDSEQAIRCLAASPGGVLAAGANDAGVYLYSLRRHRALGVLEGHLGPVRGVLLVGAGGAEGGRRARGHAVSAGEDGRLAVWRLEDSEMLTSLPCGRRAASSLALHPSGGCFTALAGSSVLLYALDTCRQAGRLRLGRRGGEGGGTGAGAGAGTGAGGGAGTGAGTGAGAGPEPYFHHAWREGPALPRGASGAPEGSPSGSPSPGPSGSSSGPPSGDPEPASQLLLLSPRTLRLVELRGERQAEAEYTLADLGTKLTAAAFAEVGAGPGPGLGVILAGDNRGVLRVLQVVPRGPRLGEAPFRLAVRAKFALSSSRVKALVPAPGGLLCALFSDGELAVAALRSLAEISVLKRLYVPGRPTAACVYGGRLDRAALSRLERPGPGPESGRETSG